MLFRENSDYDLMRPAYYAWSPARHGHIDLGSCGNGDTRNLNVHFRYRRHLNRWNHDPARTDRTGSHECPFRILLWRDRDRARIPISNDRERHRAIFLLANRARDVARRSYFFTINGKSFPETETLKVRVGQKVRLRIVGSGQFIHPMHLHGQPFRIMATDGNPVPETARLIKDTVLVGPGERYDIEFVVRAPGKWLFHCHINHHTTNDGVEEMGAGGLTMIIEVS